jgi:glycosyltransferase involved in cell wall biosynthesis
LIVGIDARAATNTADGIGRYTYQLIAHLLALSGPEQYVAFTNRNSPTLQSLTKGQARLQINVMEFPCWGFSQRVLWDQLFLPSELFRHKVDIFWGPYMIIPLIGCFPSVVTIHDLTFFEYPEHYPHRMRSYWRRWVPKAVRKAKIVIAISEYTKAAIVRMIPEVEEKVRVVYPGIEESFLSPPTISGTSYEALIGRFKIRERYLLTVGGLESSHKNLRGAIEAFAVLRRQHKIDHQFVIVGRRGSRSHWIDEVVKDLGIGDYVVMVGSVDDEDLRLLYQEADLFVMPSFNEGFGFPLLEAMACGTPVAASNRGSIPEIISNCGLLFDPNSPRDMADKMLTLLKDAELRRELTAKGYLRCRQFSWGATAEGVLAFLRNANSS